MNSIVRAAYTQWADGQRSVLEHEDGDSDGSSSPLVTRQLAPGAAQRELPGSPRRNGMVLDASLRSIFSMRAAGHLRSRSRSPDKYQGCERPPLLGYELFRGDLVDTLPVAPAPNRMTPGRGQQLIPPSLSNLSLQSASSGTSWQSASSTSSRKHSLELAFDGSPRPKRRLLAETASAATVFRYSAPYAQSGLGTTDGNERRGGFLRRSGAPIQSLLSAADNDGRLPSIPLYLGSECDSGVGASRYPLPDPFCPRPRPSHRANVTSVPIEQQKVQNAKGYSFWRLASPPGVEYTIHEVSREEGASPIPRAPLPRPRAEASAHRASTNTNTGHHASWTRPHSDADSQRVADAEPAEGGSGARSEALRALEGTRMRMGGVKSTQNGDNIRTGGPGEEKPMILCGDRLYSDWAGDWGRLRDSPFSQAAQLLNGFNRRRSAQNPRGRRSVSGRLSPSRGEPGTLDLSSTRLPDHLLGSLGARWALQCECFVLDLDLDLAGRESFVC